MHDLYCILNCNEIYCGECVRHLNVRIGEYIGTSPLTKKQAEP